MTQKGEFLWQLAAYRESGDAAKKEVVPMSMLIEVWGSYACFSRPEMIIPSN